MGYDWNAYAVPEVLAFVAATVVAAFVYLSRPQQSTNRRLALVLFLQGLYHGSRGLGRLADPASAGPAFAWLTASSVAFAPVPFLYLHFLATLETPIVRPLRSTIGKVVLAAGAAVSVALAILQPKRFILDVFHNVLATWVSRLGPWWIPRTVFESAVFVYGFLVALSAWRLTPNGSIARKRARAYAVAFGVHDLATLLRFLVVSPIAQFSEDPILLRIAVLAPGLTSLVFVALLGYGILRTQLFDIDLRIKVTIRRGTVVGVFVAAVYVATQLVENYFPQRLGPYAGAVAAGLLLFALTPLQRFAERVAEAAMPNVASTTEYLTFRKFEVYKEAVEDLLRDGTITSKERSMLDNLQRQLGIRSTDAAEMERNVRLANPAVA